MKRATSKWISCLLLMTLLVGILPPMTAFAAVQLKINNLYTVPTTQVDEITAANDADVLRVTINPINLSVTIDGIADDQIANVYYEITNMNSGVTSQNRTNKAAKNPNVSNEITFENVSLSEGLNKVVVKYGDTSVVSSRAGWVYFTPVTNITDLKFSGVEFINDGMYPKAPPYNGLSITGKANNSTQLEAYVSGVVYGPTVYNRGDFTFITNTGRASDLNFRGGDNEIKFISQNGTNSYNLERTFVFDNGRAFAYQANIDVVGGTTPQRLVRTPTLTKNTATNAAVTALLKVPVSPTTNITTYDYADIYILGTSQKIRYDFKTGDRFVNGAASGTISKSAPDSIDYKYFAYTLNEALPTNPASKYQEFVVEFGTVVGGIQDTTKYSFYTIDNNIPYVDHVDYMISDNAAVKLSDTGSTQLNRFPSKLRVYTTDDASAVQVRINGASYGSGTYPANAPTIAGSYGKGPDGGDLKMAEIDLNTLPDGYATLEVTPLDASSVASPQGKRTYNLTISGAPYVILNHLYNGQVFTRSTQINCGTGSAPCFAGRIVNLPESEYDNVTFQINDKVYDIKNYIVRSTTTGAVPSQYGTFVIPSSTQQVGVPTKTIVDELVGDGRKALRFSLRINGKIITETSFDIYVLSDKVPSVTKIDPVEPNVDQQLFLKKDVDTYVTTASEVTLSGEVRNSTRNGGKTQYNIQYSLPGTANKLPVGFVTNVTIPDSVEVDSNFSERFTTGVIPLPSTGDYYFQMTATNESGVTATRTVKITKETLPYVIVQPKVIRNSNNEDQANINSNYQNIQIFAEGADSVFIGKEEATKNGNNFTYEVTDLKQGANPIKFTVNRGTAKTNGTIILYNMNTPIEGAQYKADLKQNMKIFNGDIELKFPKDTKFMRNDLNGSNQYLTSARKLLFGIADIDKGSVDKDLEGNGSIYLNGSPETYRYKPVSKLYWIDAGTITPIATSDANFALKLKQALEGSGTLPMAPKDGFGEPRSFYERSYNNLVVPTNGATLTLKFDSNVRDDAWKYVSVFQYGQFPDSTGGTMYEQGWRNIGGVVDSKKNTITVPITTFGYFQVMYMNDSFEDVTNHSWARDVLDTLYSKGLMLNSDPQGGRFLPDNPITRGEFVTLLIKAFDIPTENSSTLSRITDPNDPRYQGTFGDVRRGYNIPNSNGLYDFVHIEAAARVGIVRGTSQGVFLPNEVITRQDAAVMIARAADLKMASDPAKSLASLQKTFTDANTIDLYARGAIEAVVKAGLIEGRPNDMLPGQKKQTLRFDPTDTFTRAEAGAVVMRVLQQLKKVPK